MYASRVLYVFHFFSNILDLLPTTIFPNYPPGGNVDDEENRKAIEALKNAKEYSFVDEEDVLYQESILSNNTYYFFYTLLGFFSNFHVLKCLPSASQINLLYLIQWSFMIGHFSHISINFRGQNHFSPDAWSRQFSQENI